MNAAEILDYASHHDIHLMVDSDALLVDGPMGVITSEFRGALKTHKADLIAALSDQESTITEIATRHGLTLSDLQEAAGPDWCDAEANLALANALADAVKTRRMRERGQVPPNYTSVTICVGCGPVPMWPDSPEHVLACPWCFNRLAGRPIPAPRSRSEQRGAAHD